jgi:hypothetical protein
MNAFKGMETIETEKSRIHTPQRIKADASDIVTRLKARAEQHLLSLFAYPYFVWYDLTVYGNLSN